MAQPALDLLSRIGMENVAAQVERLTRAFLDGARALGAVSKTPAASVGPLVVLQATDAGRLLAALAARGVVASSRRDGVRFAFHVYNTLDDVARTLAALEAHADLLVRT